jgi:prophage antirepressor-like protein
MTITTFNFSANPLRVVFTASEPWFVAADVCALLTISNNRDALGRLDDDEKGVGSIDTLGGTQEMTIVNESGLYSLILGSRKPEAKKFKKWVTSEVLPAIRKNGYYADPDLVETVNDALFASDAAEVRMLHRLDEVQTQLIDTQGKLIDAQTQLVQALRAQLAPKPKRRPAKKLTSEDIVFMRALKGQGLSVSAIAKRMGIGQATVSYMTREVDLSAQH